MPTARVRSFGPNSEGGTGMASGIKKMRVAVKIYCLSMGRSRRDMKKVATAREPWPLGAAWWAYACW